jgi:hypothetical protein
MEFKDGKIIFNFTNALKFPQFLIKMEEFVKEGI